MDIVPMTRTYDYPYFNLRLTWGEVEAEEYRVRVLKGRAACSRGGPALHDGVTGAVRVFFYQRVAPTPRPPWYSKSP